MKPSQRNKHDDQITYKVRDVTTPVHNTIIFHLVNVNGLYRAGVAGAMAKRYNYGTTHNPYKAYRRVIQASPSREAFMGTTQIVPLVPKEGIYVHQAFCIDWDVLGLDMRHLKTCLAQLRLTQLTSGCRIQMPFIGAGIMSQNWEVDILPLIAEAGLNNDRVTVCCHDLKYLPLSAKYLQNRFV